MSFIVIMKNYCSIDEQPKMACLHCLETKPLTLFKKDPTMLKGRMRMCNICYNKRYRKIATKYPPIKHLPNEEWKFISELHNKYKISNKGRIMSVNYKNSGYPFILILPTQKGYNRINLLKKNWSVHRLVALYFIGNPPNENSVVNHINGIPNDNRVENLEWCSQSENLKHAFKIGNKSNLGQKHSRTKLKDKDVQEIKIMIAKGHDARDILSVYEITPRILRGIKSGATWNHIKI